LTSHGVLQATRLGAHIAGLSSSHGRITNIFSSNLQRASKTAQLVLEGQSSISAALAESEEKVKLTQLTELRERDFGSREGEKFASGLQPTPSKNLVSMETREAMSIRAERFLDMHLFPLLSLADTTKPSIVVVVSHGLILNVIIQSLLAKFSQGNVKFVGGAMEYSQKTDYVATWSNTGYIEAAFCTQSPSNAQLDKSSRQALEKGSKPSAQQAVKAPSRQRTWPGSIMTIKTINATDHLFGLKKTGGGIGSAKYDAKQRTMDSFFKRDAKKRKSEEGT
jgi:2,3-bisphosphoglycerate-dependent phosphoglycerate mutase